MTATRAVSRKFDDYTQLRTLPAMLSVAFVLASLYQMGGLGTLELVWLDYTLTTSHAVLISAGSFVVAFASSETRSFEHYDDWEQAVIAAGPAVILGEQYVPFVADQLSNLGEPGYMVAFLVTVASWGVAVR